MGQALQETALSILGCEALQQTEEVAALAAVQTEVESELVHSSPAYEMGSHAQLLSPLLHCKGVRVVPHTQ
jgi:hypothetical protein